MATKAKTRKKGPDILDKPMVSNDFTKLLEHIKQNPVLYGVGLVLLLLCIAAGLIYRTGAGASSRSSMTQLMQAVNTEDPKMRETQLEQVADKTKALSADALYLAAEAAYESKDYAKAKEMFEKFRSQYPDSSRVADAVEGLGFIAQNEKQEDKAIEAYREILAKWPTSLTARRQYFNIASIEEKAGKLAEAAKDYQEQIDKYPGSNLETEARAVLDRLKKSNPELFPKVEEPKETVKSADKPTADKPAESAPAEAAAAPVADNSKPAEAAPAETSAPTTEKPAESAPAEAPASTQ